MKNITSTLFFMAAVAAFAGCDSNPGPDSISSHGGGTGSGTLSSCTTVCHTPAGEFGPDPLSTNGSGTAGKHVAHVTSRGISCVKCHFNYDTNPAHFNGVVNSKGVAPSPVLFDSSNSAGTWSYVAPSGTCSSTTCHRPSNPDWYSAATVTLDTVCSNCHNAPLGSIRRQITGTAGDFATNPSITSHHVAAGDPASSQCTVCHDQSLHMGGTVRLRHADTGTRIDFVPANPATLEPFCLSCHDEDGALATAVTPSVALSPFADGQTLGTMPYLASTTIASSWTGSSTHRSRGLTCAGAGAPGTGCHGRNGSINAHGSVNKGILTNTMNFTIPLVSANAYTSDPLGSSDYANNYKLCFDCHANHPAVTKEVVLGYRSGGVYNIQKAPTPYYTLGMQSLFRDRYIGDPANYPLSWGGIDQLYNDTMWDDPYLALHNYHLLGFEGNVFADPTVNMLRWNYRGDPAQTGRITCTACHNVHGTVAATIRGTHPELGLTVNDLTPPLPGESYTSLSPFMGPGIMTSFPLSCAVDCHGNMGQSSYWHTPNGE